MAFSNNPVIVRDGLVLCLNAADPLSYPGTGTTWTDVSGNNYTFTMYNGPAFNTLNGGNIILDGTNDYIERQSTPALKSTTTLVMWLKTTRTTMLLLTGNAGISGGPYYVAAYYPGQGFYSGTAGSPSYYIDCTSVANPAPTYLDGNWHMWEVKSLNFVSWTDTWNFGGYNSFNTEGSIGAIMMYSRDLTAAESLQNYNSMKSRFGIK